ncbi:MAG: hypothetical protein Q7S22_05435 [Candidatus Micrarchaeota archaeon]|nr:hypothetical protein [Candidatus Micrarchaeota archaeon]
MAIDIKRKMVFKEPFERAYLLPSGINRFKLDRLKAQSLRGDKLHLEDAGIGKSGSYIFHEVLHMRRLDRALIATPMVSESKKLDETAVMEARKIAYMHARVSIATITLVGTFWSVITPVAFLINRLIDHARDLGEPARKWAFAVMAATAIMLIYAWAKKGMHFFYTELVTRLTVDSLSEEKLKLFEVQPANGETKDFGKHTS